MVYGLDIINGIFKSTKKIPDRPDMQTKQLECRGLDKHANQHFNKELYSRASWLWGCP
jgi:hypothetical protein